MDYYDSYQYKEDCKAGWEKVKTWYDLCDNMILFIKSVIPLNNYYHNLGQYTYETPQYKKLLREINEHKFLTTDSQPGGIFDNFIQREYVEISFPLKYLPEVINHLKKYKIFVLITISNTYDEEKVFKDANHLNILTIKQTNTFTTYLMGFSISKKEYITESGKYNFAGENYSDVIYNCPNYQFKNNDILPLTIFKHQDDCPCNVKKEISYIEDLSNPKFPVSFVFRKNAANIFSDIFTCNVLKNIATIKLVDPNWNNPGYVFLIIKTMVDDIKIEDIDFS